MKTNIWKIKEKAKTLKDLRYLGYHLHDKSRLEEKWVPLAEVETLEKELRRVCQRCGNCRSELEKVNCSVHDLVKEELGE